jgi:hypothetical protein
LTLFLAQFMVVLILNAVTDFHAASSLFCRFARYRGCIVLCWHARNSPCAWSGRWRWRSAAAA